jgi:hypothetical protein
MGIEQLVDMYKGNPGPLEAKVEKDQQGQKPGELPADLEEALALQKIAELQTGAKNQQAMQAGSAQPSIVEKLKQMLAAQQRQQAQPPQMPQGMPQGMPPQQGMPQMAQGQPPMPQGPQGQPPMPQGQPVMAARGGSIDQLMSNLGRHYAGGGIIAFNGEDESKVEDEEIKKKLQQYTLQQQGADYVARKQAARLAEAEDEIRRQALVSQIPTGGREAPASTGRMPGEAERNISNAMAAMPGTSAAKAFSGSGIRALMGLLGFAGDREDKPAMESVRGGRPTMANDPRLARDFNPTPTGPGAGKATGAAIKNQITGTSPDDIRPSAGGPSAGGPAAPAAALDPNSLRGLIEANIRKELGKDEDAEWRKGSKRYEDFVGLDKLLQPREARIAEREAMLKKIQGERTPAWVEALSAAGRPVRGGLGTLLSQMGGAAESTRKGYSAEDLKFFDEIGAMRDEVAKLKLEGKYKAAAAGESAIKDAIANKRQAEQSGTSLVATDERTETSKQIAKDNAAARVAAAAARGAGSGAGDRQQLNELKALQSSLKDQLKEPRMMGKAGDELRRQLGIVNAEIAKMAGLSTMATAPGAASPGGTSKPGWGIKPI